MHKIISLLKRKYKNKSSACLIVILLIIAVASGFFLTMKDTSENENKQQIDLSPELIATFTNAEELVLAIHDGMSSHAQSFTISYRSSNVDINEAKELAQKLIDCAMYNTSSATEGDYVRYQYGGFDVYTQKTEDKNGYNYQLKIIPVYYSTVKEEQKVDERVVEIIESINKKLSELEKIKAVYDYICTNVKYDHVHENNVHYYKDSTAYAALVKNSASCQGYAVAVFRLLKELGIECRVVTGMGTNSLGEKEFHAWNQVIIDGECYNLDATWDAGKEDYDYFMIKDEDFVNHDF